MKKETTTRRTLNRTSKGLIIAIVGITSILTTKIILDAIEKRSLKTENVSQEKALNEAYYQLDSIEGELDIRIEKIRSLGGAIDTLLFVKAELEKEKTAIRERTNRTISELQDKVEGYTELLLAKDEEIEKLRSTNKVLLTENVGLKKEKKVLKRSIRKLHESKEELSEKVAVASRLSIGHVVVSAITKRGREIKGKLRRRRIKTLRVAFDILPNEVAEADGKSILLRILDQKGDLLFDVHKGAGSFTYQQKERFYTLKQDILYDKTKKSLVFRYEKPSKYTAGVYTLEVYTEGYLMGTDTFVIK